MSDLYGRHWSTGQGSVPDGRSRDEAVYLPGRNLALSVKAAVFCALNKIPVLAIGSLKHNPFADASPRFFGLWAEALGKGLRWPLKIEAPYRHRSKAEVIRRGWHWPLELSFSCIAPRKRIHCGLCNKCAERRRAFKLSGIEDKTVYVQP
jgi:7-cyano-7-deazaguanine synthase